MHLMYCLEHCTFYTQLYCYDYILTGSWKNNTKRNRKTVFPQSIKQSSIMFSVPPRKIIEHEKHTELELTIKNRTFYIS